MKRYRASVAICSQNDGGIEFLAWMNTPSFCSAQHSIVQRRSPETPTFRLEYVNSSSPKMGRRRGARIELMSTPLWPIKAYKLSPPAIS